MSFGSGIRPDWKKLGNKWNKVAIDFAVGTTRELADDPEPSSGTTSVLPSGGTTDQVLAKNSNTSYDVGWHDAADFTAEVNYATLVKFGV